MKTREDKRIVKLEFFLSKLPFWDMCQKANTFTFWCMVILLGPHSVYT